MIRKFGSHSSLDERGSSSFSFGGGVMTCIPYECSHRIYPLLFHLWLFSFSSCVRLYCLHDDVIGIYVCVVIISWMIPCGHPLGFSSDSLVYIHMLRSIKEIVVQDITDPIKGQGRIKTLFGPS